MPYLQYQHAPQNDVTLKMPAFEWVHVQLHQQKGMISLSPPTICNSAAKVDRIFGDMPRYNHRNGSLGGSHFMARKLEELGRSPKLISPQFVRPFVKSNKNDFVDAEAICEAASRPSMRLCSPERNLSSNAGSASCP
jgi:hypothetical protein